MKQYSIIIVDNNTPASDRAFDLAFEVLQNTIHPNKGSIGSTDAQALQNLGITVTVYPTIYFVEWDGSNRNYIAAITGNSSYDQIYETYQRVLSGDISFNPDDLGSIIGNGGDSIFNTGSGNGGSVSVFQGTGSGGVGLLPFFNLNGSLGINIPPAVYMILAGLTAYKTITSDNKILYGALTGLSLINYINSTLRQ